MARLVYWHTHCPRCHEEGEMVIARHRATASLCFRCDECSWYCFRMQDLAAFERGREGFEELFDFPNLSEIQAAGWGAFAIHSMEVPDDYR